MAKKKLTFEDALSRLEDIVSEMESADVSLDSSVKLYKEAVELSVFLNTSLNEYENQVMELSKTAEGVFKENTLY